MTEKKWDTLQRFLAVGDVGRIVPLHGSSMNGLRWGTEENMTEENITQSKDDVLDVLEMLLRVKKVLLQELQSPVVAV
jgi:hypothetical protein